MIAATLGIRNLTRNRWRSGLTIGAVAVAVALMVWTVAFYEGWLNQMIRGATAVETSQVQIHTAEYIATPRVYRSFALHAAMVETIERVPGVVAVSPRVALYGLVGNEERSQVARIMGVDPEREARATPVADGIVSGRWLESRELDSATNREVVLGSGLARQLQVGPGDELVVFLEASDGSLGNDILEVAGIVRTGDTRIDRTTMYMALAGAQFLAALDGQIHELAVRTVDPYAARETAALIAAATGAHLGDGGTSTGGGATLVVRPWQVILPGINQMLVLFRRSYWIMYLLVYFVAAIGIINTQRMAALERRREFGIMIAIGMRPRRMLRTLVVETVVLGTAGAIIGAMLGGALAWYHTTFGFDMSMFTTEAAFTYMGVAFSDRIYFVMTAATVYLPILVMVGIALLSGFWPGLQAARIDPAPTISGRGA